jgi:predicted amidohydrolase YtcJ
VASLRRAGIRYAASSDAPVTEPSPGQLLEALQRSGPSGFGERAEALSAAEALAALTRWPARAAGAPELGELRQGAPADVAIVDPSFARSDVRYTLVGGAVVFPMTG